MIIYKSTTTSFSFDFLKKRMQRESYFNNEIVAIRYPLIDIGMEERTHYRVYYLVFWRFCLFLHRKPSFFIPCWSEQTDKREPCPVIKLRKR